MEEPGLNSHVLEVGVILTVCVCGILNLGKMLGLITSGVVVFGQSATLLGSWICAVCCLARERG